MLKDVGDFKGKKGGRDGTAGGRAKGERSDAKDGKKS